MMSRGLLSLLLLASFAHSTTASSNNSYSKFCHEETHPFDSFVHKSVYTVGVHAIRGLDSAVAETNMTFATYLTETAGKRFDPPIQFQVKPFYFDGIFNAIDNDELDFLYSNPGVYSCIGTEVGATALTTAVKRLTVRDKTFDLDVYGGVIAVRADNKEINSIGDLKDKIIGAGAIIDLMAGQMQIYEMGRAGLSYVNDPRQVVFTKNQIDVVNGVLDGIFDVGFIRTDQIEITEDEHGNLLDPDLFKIIEPKIYVMQNGDIFPFLHSTDIFPEWPLAAMDSVASDVALEVQEALLSFEKYAKVGDEVKKCKENLDADFCEAVEPWDYYAEAPCDTTHELAELASTASKVGLFAGFRTSRSYFELRTMQQEAGFMLQNDEGDWYCTRPSNLYEGITCPEGFFKRSEDEFLNGCAQVGLSCDQNEDYDCFCKPCVEAYDVDVYEHEAGAEDLHLVEHYGTSLPGCKKMSICGQVEQGESITLRIYDNEMRDGATVHVVSHAGDEEKELWVNHIEGTYAYEFTVFDKAVQTQVVDISVNGVPISQSPIRVMVVPKDCDVIYGESALRQADALGNCVCRDNTYELGSKCLEAHWFFLMIFGLAFAVLAVFVGMLLQYKKKQTDSVWHVSVDELHLNEPPEVIGQGAFGVVVLGQYRGTKVAVKRVLPPEIKQRKDSHHSSQLSGSGSLQLSNKAPSKTMTASMSKKDPKVSKPNVQFLAEVDGDIEAPPDKKHSSSNISMSNNKAWEELLLDDRKYNSALKVLETATLSNHGSSSWNGFYMASSSSRSRLSDMVPLWMRFDEHSRLRREFVNEMRLLSRLRHPCITTVMGAVIAPRVDPMLVMEYMEYGSLYDLLRNETMYAGGEIILQIIKDITQGINFLHSSRPPILHGDLKAKNILVDSRFRAKVADFGFSHIKCGTGKTKSVLQGTPIFLAPEYLKRKTEYSTECDMYSYGMILYEIYARSDPFEGEDLRDILPKVCHPRINKRPPVPEACPPKMAEVMKKCWSANPFFRPSAKDVDYILVEMSSKEAEPLVGMQQNKKERNRPTSLYDVFPKAVADALNAGKKVEPESHEIVTVVFSDIVGFTTISQTFEPIQVSKMLDRLYNAFDACATRHNVFKVETIGDAYMGVTNLSGQEFETHVKQVAEYAMEIIAAASKILIDEDAPEKGCVKIRVGFHSGPVVSNVIGSLNPRYGLFGDTVNTASRMESNSVVGRIHCTHAAAQLLMQQAPEIPVTLRGKIEVKGKGKMMTYWVGNEMIDMDLPPIPDVSEAASESVHNILADLANIEDEDDEEVDDAISAGDTTCTPKTEEMSDCPGSSFSSADQDDNINVVSDILLNLIKQIVAARPRNGAKRTPAEDAAIKELEQTIGKDVNLLEKASEAIVFPDTKDVRVRDLKRVVLGNEVQQQLHHFVEVVASKHNSEAPFHSFDHAVSVCEAANRWLYEASLKQSDTDDCVAGIATDSVSRFAAVIAALLHDVDHRSMPNSCLSSAEPTLHEKYRGKATQEQNSLEKGWEIWLRPEFADLRACIYQTKDEFVRFHQILVHEVIATDIFDPDMARDRLTRWEEAFDLTAEGTDRSSSDQKSVALLELLIQAADISHTMQSWTKYIRWNSALFHEMRRDYKLGLLQDDPCLTWYEGETKFFDTYVIPLAHRMQDCGVFGTSGVDCMRRAERNRRKWQQEGPGLVNSWVAVSQTADEFFPAVQPSDDAPDKKKLDTYLKMKKDLEVAAIA
ncbi:activated protein kinase catalytic subunit alpha-1 [Seminavis robusta]|uniref:guanylate cyclase n=1 Tax=Seminavis robusta TaxID=568900 RepID=A0A9N8DA63_9STRA|nr:activated protein kinase catalytic subunit alpha-1 [Seminavis robusta]|eukprot:Sro61_g034950.1 activated protein kinase catalytic subunit alpha-1 (1733) ;mRNA; f:43376-49958